MRVTGEFSTGMITRTQLSVGSLVDCFKRSEDTNKCIDEKCSGNFSQDLLGIIKSMECKQSCSDAANLKYPGCSGS